MALQFKPTPLSSEKIWRNPIYFIACGFGFGTFPYVPGTIGTLVAIPIYLVLVKLPMLLYILAIIAMQLFGIYACGKTNRDFKTDDHPAACWDEIAAFPIVMLGIPVTALNIVMGFLLFRLFDIWKPWPIRWFDKQVHSGFGVMFDDVLAALFSLASLFLFLYLIKL